MTRPGIDLLVAPSSASDLVLLAHGGEVQSLEEAHDWRGAILRMWPLAAAAGEAAPGAAIGLLRYRYRGWNGEAAHPAADLRAVLDGLPDRIRRIVLIGHSMGGRAVLAAGNHAKVVGILGLAPWLPPGERITLTPEPPRTVVLAHGSEDRVTDPRLTAAYARRLRAAGVPVGLLTVENDKHAMLRRYADWNELVRRFTHHTLATATSAADPSSAAGAAPAAAGVAAASDDALAADLTSAPDAPADTSADAAGGTADDCAAVLSTERDRVDQLPRWNRPAHTSAAVRDITRARLRLRLGVGGAL